MGTWSTNNRKVSEFMAFRQIYRLADNIITSNKTIPEIISSEELFNIYVLADKYYKTTLNPPTWNTQLIKMNNFFKLLLLIYSYTKRQRQLTTEEI